MSKTNRFTGEHPDVHPFLGYEVPLEKDVMFGTDNFRFLFKWSETGNSMRPDNRAVKQGT